MAYWFPKMAVYDDLRRWDAEAYRGNAAFYDSFGDYRVFLTGPAGWTVMATGDLENDNTVYSEQTLERLDGAARADTLVTVADREDRAEGRVTLPATGGEGLNWEFRTAGPCAAHQEVGPHPRPLDLPGGAVEYLAVRHREDEAPSPR